MTARGRLRLAWSWTLNFAMSAIRTKANVDGPQPLVKTRPFCDIHRCKLIAPKRSLAICKSGLWATPCHCKVDLCRGPTVCREAGRRSDTSIRAFQSIEHRQFDRTWSCQGMLRSTIGLIFRRCALRLRTSPRVAMDFAPAASAHARCRASPARNALVASSTNSAAR